MSPRNQKLSPCIDGRLAAYATLAGVALAVPAAAKADIVYVNLGGTPINIPSTTAGVYLNVVTGVNGATPGAVPGWDVNPFSSTALSMFTGTGTGSNGAALGGVGAYVGTGTNYLNLWNQVGTFVIGPTTGGTTYGGTGTNTISATTPLNLSSSNNVVGFRFFNEGTSQVNYAWMQISLAGTAQGQPRSILGYAYDNSGISIRAGEFAPGQFIPEPSTLSLLSVMAAGAVGVRAWRRQRERAAPSLEEKT